jgi:hypothetical protein
MISSPPPSPSVLSKNKPLVSGNDNEEAMNYTEGDFD